MLANRFLPPFIFQLLTIPAVISLFRNLDRIPASFIATALFLFAGGWALRAGYRAYAFRGISTWGAIQFLVLFAIPIAITRVLNPSLQGLDHLSFGPISLAIIHRFSNISFVLMMVATLGDLIRHQIGKKKGA